MTKTRIVTSFNKYNDADLEQKAELIVSSLEDNAYFTDIIPPLEVLKTAVEAFDLAIVKAKEGGKTEMLERNNKRNDLIALLDKLALFVQMQGDGNDVALASSGFSLSKTPQPIGILPKPREFTVSAPNVGSISLKLKAIYGAKTYQYEYRRKGDETWTVQTHTKPILLLTDLESGTAYEFRVTGVGSNPQRVYSDVLSSYVL